MVKKLIKEKEVVSALTDVNVCMGLLGTQSVIQDNMCDYFREIGSDGLLMIPVANCFFVVTKSKTVFRKTLSWRDKFVASSEPVSKTRLKFNLCTQLKCEDGVVAECVQEMVAIDATTRSPRLIDTTLVPKDLECVSECGITFSRMMFEVSVDDLVATRKVDVTNVDFYKHTNNLEYIRFMLATLDLDYLINHKVAEFEIHYLIESRCCDVLDIYRKEVDEGMYFQVNRGQDVIVKALIKFEERDAKDDIL